MKKLLTIAAIFTLSACSTFTARQYDAVEYDYAVRIAVNATHAAHLCKEEGPDYQTYLHEMNRDSALLQEYVSNKEDTTEALPAAIQVRGIVMSFLAEPKRTVAYCKHKINNVQASARMYARAVGSSSKFNPCDGSPEDRLVDFKKSYDAKAITKPEFADLVDDLRKLTTIDASSCTLENRAKMAKLASDLQSLSGLLAL
jgi:hypothetical protein